MSPIAPRRPLKPGLWRPDEPAQPPPEAVPAKAAAPPETAPAPTSTPPEATPVAAPPAVEAAPVPAADTISDADLTAALEIVKKNGASIHALRDGLRVFDDRAKALLTEMEKRGIVGPVPTKPGTKRKILITTWPPEVAPAGTVSTVLEPAPAKPPAAEPARVEPPPAGTGSAPPGTPPSTTGETPPETPPGTTEVPTATAETKKKSFFRHAFDRFTSKFRGEVQPEEEKDYKGTLGDLGRNTVLGGMSVVAGYLGIKFGADVLARVYQTRISNPAERRRILEAFLSETELGETVEPTAINQKKAKLKEAIYSSKFKTKEEKAELLGMLYKTVDEYEKKERSLREELNKKILDILEENIQTRVKNTQLLKEGLNSALAAGFLLSGGTAVWAQGLRGPAFSLVAIFERHQEVIKSPERRVQYIREMTVRGFTDTLKNLGGGDAKFLSIRGGLNVVKGATNVLRAAGFTSLTLEALTGEDLIDHALNAWEKYTGTATPDIPGEPTGATGTAAQSPLDVAKAGSAAAGLSLDEEPLDVKAAAAASAAGAAVEAGGGEFTKETIETGTVQKGDGILKILDRQGISPSKALEAAREAGIVRAGGDTRLATEAIGRLSIFAETQPDGDIEIKFLDTQTNKVLTLAQAREAGFTYEHGTVPGEIPTEGEEVVAKLERAGDGSAPTVEGDYETTAGVPHDLASGGVKIIETTAGLSLEFYTAILTEAQATTLDGILNESPIESSLGGQIEVAGFETQSAAQRLVEASAILEKLESGGKGDSAEAHYLRGYMKMDLETADATNLFESEKITGLEQQSEGYKSERYLAGAEVASRVESIRVQGLGNVEFEYDLDGRPSLDWQQLVQASKRFIEQRVEDLLIPNWQEVLHDRIVDGTIAKSELDIGGPIVLMLDAIKELESGGNGDTTEAIFLHAQLGQNLKTYDHLLNADHAVVQEAVAKADVGRVVELGASAEAGAPAAVGVAAGVAEARVPLAVPEAPADTEPLHRFRGDAARVKFVYKPDGSVEDAFIPAYTPKPGQVEAALNAWGLTREQVGDHFFEGYRSTTLDREYLPSASPGPRYATSANPLFTDRSPGTLYQDFERAVEKLARQEATLGEMRARGLASTPEFERWRSETVQLRDWVAQAVKKEFPSRTT